MPFAIAKKHCGIRDKDISPALLAPNVGLLSIVCSDEWPGQNRAGNQWIEFDRTVRTNDGLPAHLHECSTNSNLVR